MMAEKRMIAKTIVDSDAFLDMPISARLLYYDLNMRADDDGFVNSPKKVMRITGASIDDMNILITRKFIIPFDSGIVVIKHWRIHNYIRKDMYHETKYKDEKSTLFLDENGAYTLQPCNELVTNPSTQNRLDKNRLDIDNNIYSPAKAEQCKQIISYLNEKCNTKYRFNTPKTVKLIETRLKEGFTVEDFKKVIDNMSADWLGDNKMERFLRPETLFSNKFESYLNHKPKPQKQTQFATFEQTKNDAELDEMEELLLREVNR